MKDQTLMLLDTASLYFRASYALPTSLRARDGRPVNAVRGLLDFIAVFVERYGPNTMACCWDDDWRPAWRIELVNSYKAHRATSGDEEDVPPELAPQVPLIRDVLTTLGLPVVGHPGFEADDVIATLASKASGPVLIVTGDRDLFQAVDDARDVRVLYVSRGVSRHEVVTDAWLRTRYGVDGSHYVDFSVLRGDQSDGLPGIRGIGEKTAAALIGRYGDLEAVVAATPLLAPGLRRALEGQSAYLDAARKVVTAATHVPIGELDLALPLTPRDPERFAELRQELNLGGSAERLVAALASRYPVDPSQ